MTRKKKVKEEQAVTAEVVETKKKSSKKAPKTKMSAQKESIQETGVQEPIVKEENTKDSFKDKFRYKSRFICQWDMKKSRPPLSLWRGGLSV